jgi:dihydroxyacetone kinase
LATAWESAAEVATEAAAATSTLLPKMGRARPHAEKSLGTPDAGAVSMALIVRAIHNTLTENTSAENTFSNNTVKENA